MKVLILSCSTGGGHNSCARYIEEELKANNQVECYQDDLALIEDIIKRKTEIFKDEERKQRILNLYALYNEDFRRLYEAEHKKKEENVVLDDTNSIEIKKLNVYKLTPVVYGLNNVKLV